MRSITTVLTAALLTLSGNVYAASVVDVYNNDLNVITHVIAINDPVGFSRTGVNVEESYGESTLISYPSQGGKAVVNAALQYFDKTVTIAASDQHSDWDSMYINLKITNNTPYPWSDYHLIFYNQNFTQKLGLTLLSVNTSPYFGNELFDKSTTYGYLGGSEIDFWSNTATQNPGQTNNIWLRWDWGNPLDDHAVGYTIGIRQVATTVIPIPGAIWLLASGLLGLAGLKINKVRKGV